MKFNTDIPVFVGHVPGCPGRGPKANCGLLAVAAVAACNQLQDYLPVCKPVSRTSVLHSVFGSIRRNLYPADQHSLPL